MMGALVTRLGPAPVLNALSSVTMTIDRTANAV